MIVAEYHMGDRKRQFSKYLKKITFSLLHIWDQNQEKGGSPGLCGLKVAQSTSISQVIRLTKQGQNMYLVLPPSINDRPSPVNQEFRRN